MKLETLRTVAVTRYIAPLREGGSLPALVEADDDFKYVLKFKGAGHGTKALISEFLGGQLARVLGLKLPELVFITLDEDFGRSEADEEIQDLLRGSHGLNLGLHFLSGAITFDPVVTTIDSLLASKIVWLDAFLTNIDRTFRNTNMLIWNKELWLIDHGASFYFHHSWDNWEQNAKSPFSYVKDHVLLDRATQLDEVNTQFTSILTDELFRQLVDQIPSEWLQWEGNELSEDEIRGVYHQFLSIRLAHSANFLNEAQDARKKTV
ncbi:MAG: aminotransferase class I and II [Candidatus Fluviicola riflensis]|nr:MAG: aminotransferase class I and II [Candidatus Fluviicola riflensis]OGS79336.1 MAG: aminotransferase class I and II [Candidatus Fluviicola riflensis]OGS86768.1 MAG: aminotransferase class I and II [Fluviicola sp. RIFCSPHIGHO2_01_FULL_43_53]OGS88759.1 MAG: aminotransferase class I and II [Fluviicola sp. RIFCSPHIGHO2_12_FULL_43_24]